AWLDWARAADRPDTARIALRAIGSERLGPVARLAWRAWFAQRGGDVAAERQALEGWLAIEPRNPTVLSRLAALATQAGEAGRGRCDLVHTRPCRGRAVDRRKALVRR